MNKKFFTALLSFITICFGVSAQEAVKSSGHLAVDVELFSTTGVGIELATPLGSHLALRGGISFLPTYSRTDNFKVNLNESFKTQFNNAIHDNPDLASVLKQQGIESADNINTDVEATATLNFFNGKILIDFYPSAIPSFHITGGVYIGKSDIIKVKGTMAQAVKILDVLDALPPGALPGYSDSGTILFTNEGNDYGLTGNDIRNMQGAISVNSVKPYFGIGFGRAVPKKRVGVNFEIGAFYQGAPKPVGNTTNIQKLIDTELTGVTETIKRISIYPVISLKVNFRVF